MHSTNWAHVIFWIQHICTVVGFKQLFIQNEATDGEDANRLLDAASVLLDFLSLSILAGDLWPCGCVLICWRYYYINYLARGRSKPHQHPVSREACFVSTPRPQLRLAGSPDSITCITPVQQKHTVPNPETHSYQKSCPKLYRLITKAWGSMWPDCDPCNYSLSWACSSSSCLRLLEKELACERAACGDRLINRMVVDGVHTLGKCPVSAGALV